MASRKTIAVDTEDALEAAADASQDIALSDPDTDALFDMWDTADVVEVGGFDSDVWDESTPIVGFRLRTRLEVGPHKSTMYELDTRDGLFSVWGATVLDVKMAEVPEGALVRIELLGERQGDENTYKDYSVKYKTVPGAGLAVTSDAAPF